MSGYKVTVGLLTLVVGLLLHWWWVYLCTDGGSTCKLMVGLLLHWLLVYFYTVVGSTCALMVGLLVHWTLAVGLLIHWLLVYLYTGCWSNMSCVETVHCALGTINLVHIYTDGWSKYPLMVDLYLCTALIFLNTASWSTINWRLIVGLPVDIVGWSS